MGRVTRKTDPAGLDTGLLAPVRAGADTEAGLTDEAWVQAMLDAEAALARAQARLGTVPPQAAATITGCARAAEIDLPGLALRTRGAANPVVALVEEFTEVVAADDPEAAHYVHRGSTSQDVFDTAAMLIAARTLRLVLAQLDRTAAALARHADAHRDTLAAARTLGQHAVPTTFGLRAAGWLVAVLDVRSRTAALLDGGLPVQLGGAAGTLAGYVEYAHLAHTAAGTEAADGPWDAGRYTDDLVALFAAETGLAEPVLPWHTTRTPLADIGAVLALASVTLGKFAADVQNLARTEVAEVAEPAGAGRGISSAMPQKRNPVLAAMIRSAALQVPSLVLTLTHCAVAEDERPAGAWHGEWQPLREALRLVGGAAATAAELAEGLVVHPERMRANLALTGGSIVAERLAAVLTPVLGKAGAKRLVARVSVGGADAGSLVDGLLAAAPELAAEFTPERLADLLAPAGYTGAASALIDRALAHHRATLPAGPRD
ncbi:lyase family protein [Streptomyces sp. NBC_01310]|uniref:lyase family protein n=1 Tax=Streptomyces sp. NBC_01310 TaxID=2903820 RepID=UPI0035B5F751|nr:lyase family protein [Streptomyces sp. NBC_01310]